MTRHNSLVDYSDAQQALVVSHLRARDRKAGFVATTEAWYPDQPILSSAGYARSPMPLQLLALMYERTALFVPPYTKRQLEDRWEIEWRDFVTLAEQRLILPILGDPLDYGSDHFTPLLEINSPALWSRGIALVEELGLSGTLDQNQCPLPIEEMASIPELRQRYRSRHLDLSDEELTKRIKREMLTHYADLWVFGDGDLADTLGTGVDAHTAASRLMLANELRTYPVLFGLDGTANYNLQDLAIDRQAFGQLNLVDSRDRSTSFDWREVESTFATIGLNVGGMSAKELVAFHASAEGLSLRKAMQYFEDRAGQLVDLSEGGGTSVTEARREEFSLLLRDACRTLQSPALTRSATRARASSRWSLVMGLPALGSWVLQPQLAQWFMTTPQAQVGLAVGGALGLLNFKSIKEALGKQFLDGASAAASAAYISYRYNPGVANLWTVKKGRYGDGQSK